ncbi:hypothetical protein [Nonomuraea dietziae]|uniref:hypothetical protein n=1 Tax=Nonomuraea dietziae TaxID=65515 RepID=UPI0031DD8ACD
MAKSRSGDDNPLRGWDIPAVGLLGPPTGRALPRRRPERAGAVRRLRQPGLEVSPR